MNHALWAQLLAARANAAALAADLDEIIRSAACKKCGGSGDLPLSREPCSTAMIDCPECDGEGWKK